MSSLFDLRVKNGEWGRLKKRGGGALVKKGALIGMGALIGIGALIYKKHIRRAGGGGGGGALIRKGALIGRRALNRIITVPLHEKRHFFTLTLN